MECMYCERGEFSSFAILAPESFLKCASCARNPLKLDLVLYTKFNIKFEIQFQKG